MKISVWEFVCVEVCAVEVYVKWVCGAKMCWWWGVAVHVCGAMCVVLYTAQYVWFVRMGV